MPEPTEYQCESCGSVFRRAGSNLCFICGIPCNPVAKKTSEVPRFQSMPVQAKDPVELIRAGRRIVKMVKWFFGAAACFILGGWLLFDSNLRDDPNKISAGEIVRGLAPVVVGIAMLVLAWLGIRRPTRGTRADS